MHLRAFTSGAARWLVPLICRAKAYRQSRYCVRPGRRCLPRSRVYRRLVAGPDNVRALGGEGDVKVFGDFAILQPETRIAIDGETAYGRLMELVRHVDAKRLKHLLVNFARPIQIRDGEVNMINHGLPLSFDCDSPDQSSAKS